MLIVVNGSVDRALGPLLFVGTSFLLSGQRLDHHICFLNTIRGGGLAYGQGGYSNNTERFGTFC